MADFTKMIATIDSHITGEGTRLITSGLPFIPGATMAEKMEYAQGNLSWVPPCCCENRAVTKISNDPFPEGFLL